MRIVLNNVDAKHTEILQKLAQTLKFKIEDVEYSEFEEDKALYQAMEEGKNSGRMNKAEQEEFENWLKNL